MENERPASKRHSLLPQRSASGFSSGGNDSDESNKLAPPSAPKTRDVSPSKLPIGDSTRARSGRQAGVQPKAASSTVASSSSSSSSRQTSHKPQTSSISLTKGNGISHSASSRSTSSIQAPSSRKILGLTKPSASARTPGKPDNVAKLPPSAHKQSASLSGKDARSSAAPTASRTLANVKIQRPASTIIQRPSSPKKPSKPPAPAANKFSLLSGPAGPALKPTHDLKLELLHLHMLYRTSQQTKDQWTDSARTHYEKIFSRLVALEDELRSNEIDFLEQRNAAALIDWCKEVSASTGESKTKVLSGVIDQMWVLVAPGGRYTASVAAFEDWYAIMERSHDLRSLGQERQHIDIMEGLGDGWKTEVDGLMNNLCLMSDALEGLGPAIEPSDIARCLNILMTLLANMLDELMLIRDIEQKLVDREGSWVKDRIEGLSAMVSGDR